MRQRSVANRSRSWSFSPFPIQGGSAIQERVRSKERLAPLPAHCDPPVFGSPSPCDCSTPPCNGRYGGTLTSYLPLPEWIFAGRQLEVEITCSLWTPASIYFIACLVTTISTSSRFDVSWYAMVLYVTIVIVVLPEGNDPVDSMCCCPCAHQTDKAMVALSATVNLALRWYRSVF